MPLIINLLSEAGTDMTPGHVTELISPPYLVVILRYPLDWAGLAESAHPDLVPLHLGELAEDPLLRLTSPHALLAPLGHKGRAGHPRGHGPRVQPGETPSRMDCPRHVGHGPQFVGYWRPWETRCLGSCGPSISDTGGPTYGHLICIKTFVSSFPYVTKDLLGEVERLLWSGEVSVSLDLSSNPESRSNIGEDVSDW